MRRIKYQSEKAKEGSNGIHHKVANGGRNA